MTPRSAPSADKKVNRPSNAAQGHLGGGGVIVAGILGGVLGHMEAHAHQRILTLTSCVIYWELQGHLIPALLHLQAPSTCHVLICTIHANAQLP